MEIDRITQVCISYVARFSHLQISSYIFGTLPSLPFSSYILQYISRFWRGPCLFFSWFTNSCLIIFFHFISVSFLYSQNSFITVYFSFHLGIFFFLAINFRPARWTLLAKPKMHSFIFGTITNFQVFQLLQHIYKIECKPSFQIFSAKSLPIFI